MLKIHIPAVERWDPVKEEFIQTKACDLSLEHSLVSISKWESKFHKAFLKEDSKTYEETLFYIKCMTLTQNVDPAVYESMPSECIEEISKYIEDPMSATYFNDEKSKGGSREVVTSELIYYWMIALNIPMECQKWHLNRLLALIRVCNLKNTPQKKMSKGEIMSRNRALNEARRKAHRSKG